MTVTVRHLKVSAIPDDSAAADAGEVLPSDWNAGHVVEIDALDGVPIGAVTPAAGTFTTLSTGTLTATGQTSLGGAAGSEGLRVTTTASANRYVQISGGQSGVSSPSVGVAGGSTALDLYTNGGGTFNFYTNGNGSARQVAFTHTASAVNYVQVTGGATGNAPYFLATGSDANVNLWYGTKGTGYHAFFTAGNGSNVQFLIANTSSAANYIQTSGSTAGNAAKLLSAGSDTNIDLALTPKGTGNVRFGTYTADMTLVVQGYITIKDSGGTVRKLAVIA